MGNGGSCCHCCCCLSAPQQRRPHPCQGTTTFHDLDAEGLANGDVSCTVHGSSYGLSHGASVVEGFSPGNTVGATPQRSDRVSENASSTPVAVSVGSSSPSQPRVAWPGVKVNVWCGGGGGGASNGVAEERPKGVLPGTATGRRDERERPLSSGSVGLLSGGREAARRPPNPTAVLHEKLIFSSTAQMRSVQTLIHLHTKKRAPPPPATTTTTTGDAATVADPVKGERRRALSGWHLLFSSNVHGFSSDRMRQQVRHALRTHVLGADPDASHSPEGEGRTERMGATPQAQGCEGSAAASTAIPVPTLLTLETSQVVYMRAPTPADREATAPAADGHRRGSCNSATATSHRGKAANASSTAFIVDADEADATAELIPCHVCVGLYLSSTPAVHVRQYYTSRDAFLFSFCVAVRPPPPPPPPSPPPPPPPPAARETVPLEVVHHLHFADVASSHPPPIAVPPLARPEGREGTARGTAPPPHPRFSAALPSPLDASQRTGEGPTAAVQRYRRPTALSDERGEEGEEEEGLDEQTAERYGGSTIWPMEDTRAFPPRWGEYGKLSYDTHPLEMTSPSGVEVAPGSADSRVYSQPEQSLNERGDWRLADHSAAASPLTSVSETTAATYRSPYYYCGPSAVAGRAPDPQPHFWDLHGGGSRVGGGGAAVGASLSSCSSDSARGTNSDRLKESLSLWAASSTVSSATLQRPSGNGDCRGRRARSASPSLSSLSTTSSSSSSSEPSDSSSSTSSPHEFPSLNPLLTDGGKDSSAARRRVSSCGNTHERRSSSTTSAAGVPRGGGGGGGGGHHGDGSTSAPHARGDHHHHHHHDRHDQRGYCRRPALVLPAKQLQRINPLYKQSRGRATGRQRKKLCVLVSDEGTLLVWYGSINKQPALILGSDLRKVLCHTQLPLVGDKRSARKLERWVRQAEARQSDDDDAAAGDRRTTALLGDRGGNSVPASSGAHPIPSSSSPSKAAVKELSGEQEEDPRRDPQRRPSQIGKDIGTAAPRVPSEWDGANHTDPNHGKHRPRSASAVAKEADSAATGDVDGALSGAALSSTPPTVAGDGPAAGFAFPRRPSSASAQSGEARSHRMATRLKGEFLSLGGLLSRNPKRPHDATAPTPAKGSNTQRKGRHLLISSKGGHDAVPPKSKKFDFAAEVVKAQLCATDMLQ